MAIDDPITLSELLDVPDLHDVMASFAGIHGVAVSIIEGSGSQARVLTTTAREEAPVCAAAARCEGPAGPSSPYPGAWFYFAPIQHQGEQLARVAVGPYREGPAAASPNDRGERGNRGAAFALPALASARAEALARHIVGVLEVLVYNAYARWVTSAMHTEAMEANFAELSAKNTRLERAVERMQEVDRLKSSFLATMSHELRTPLTSVIGYSEMLLEGMAGAINDEQRDYVRTILTKADQLLQLISGILDVSMLESGSLEMHREPIILRELVESVLAAFGQSSRKRRVTVHERGEPLPRALADPRQIRQVLRNLVANAVKFTPEGGRIDVALEVGPLKPEGVSTDASCGLRLVITDSGIGIAPDKHAQIFEPFFQVDSSSTRQYGGSGLGLTLAKRYVEAHGGHIWVESALGTGSVFTVSLPAVPEELQAFLDRYPLATTYSGSRASTDAPGE